jgi:hypothetical protein
MTKPKHITSDQMLKLLYEFFNREDGSHDDRLKLWAILTAFRGPDNGDETLKEATTSLIRERVIGFKGMKQLNCSHSTGDNAKLAELRSLMSFSHFERHARHAFDRLGLLWYVSNKKTKKKTKKS